MSDEKAIADEMAITFVCEVAKVQTLKDGAISLTVYLPESATTVMALLAEVKRQGWALATTMQPQPATVAPYDPGPDVGGNEAAPVEGAETAAQDLRAELHEAMED